MISQHESWESSFLAAFSSPSELNSPAREMSTSWRSEKRFTFLHCCLLFKNPLRPLAESETNNSLPDKSTDEDVIPGIPQPGRILTLTAHATRNPSSEPDVSREIDEPENENDQLPTGQKEKKEAPDITTVPVRT